MPPLSIILDADAIRPPLTGIGRYAYRLAEGLANHADIGDLRLLQRYRWYRYPADILRRWPVTDAPNLAVGNSPHEAAGLARLKRRVGRQLLSGLKWLRTRRYPRHIYHSPNYMLPPFPGLRVTTIHDLSVIRHPEFHPRDRVENLVRLFPGILRRCDLILTDSDFSRQEILDCFRLPDDRVRTVYLGVDRDYRPPADRDALTARLARYGLCPGAYVLSVGTIEPRKNLMRLIAAHGTLPQSLALDHPLVLVGETGWHSRPIHQAMQAAEAEGRLKYLNYVPEQDLLDIYAGARVFVCVSLYEGFGLPVLEAMASGIPVVCSRTTSLPEVGGTAVRYINPLYMESIAAGMQALLPDSQERRERIAAGLRQADLFRWEHTVSNTIKAYRSLL